MLAKSGSVEHHSWEGPSQSWKNFPWCGGLCLRTIINLSFPLLGLASNLDLLTSFTYSSPAAMPYQIRNRTRVTNTDTTPSSTASKRDT